MKDDENSFDSEEQPSAPVAKIASPPKASMFPAAEAGGAEDSIWLTSYADLMTLIACFFILMVAFANFDSQSFSRKSREMSKYFSGDKPLDQEGEPMSQLMERLQVDPALKESAQLKMVMEGIEVNFSGSALFESGQAELRPEILDALDIMIDLIHEKTPDARVLVEGHTDDAPLINSSKYRNNWELSGARSARVVERFEEFGFTPQNLAAVGYGSTRPLKPNHDKEGTALLGNMKENRRVVIKIMKAPKLMKREKIGLGVYFNDDQILDSTAPQ